MYRVIHPLVTLKRGVSLGLLILLLDARGVYIWGYSTPVTLKRGACMGLFIPLLHIRGVHAWGYLTTCYT
jgi:hypothetical protein